MKNRVMKNRDMKNRDMKNSAIWRCLRGFRMVERAGIEPATPTMSTWCLKMINYHKMILIQILNSLPIPEKIFMFTLCLQNS